MAENVPGTARDRGFLPGGADWGLGPGAAVRGAPLGYRGLNRRSVDCQATGKIDVTKDSQYDNLFTDFVEADQRMATLLKSVKKYNDAQMQLAEAAAQLADDLHIL